MIKPTQKDIGRVVIYTLNTHPVYGIEPGVIIGFSSKNIFVRYGNDTFSKGTNPKDLEWEPTRNKPNDY